MNPNPIIKRTALKTSFIGGVGTFPLSLAAKLVAEAQDGGADVFYAAAVGDFNRNTAGALQDGLSTRLGHRWIGPSTEMISDTTGFHGQKDLALAAIRQWAPYLNQMVAFLCGDSWNENIERPFGILLLGPPTGGHHTLTKWLLEELANRKFQPIRLGITVLPDEDIERRGLFEYPTYINELVTSGRLHELLVVDNRSPIASLFGAEYQDELLVKGLAGLLSAQVYFPTGSHSAADVIARMAWYPDRKLIGASFGLRPLIPLDPPRPKKPGFFKAGWNSILGVKEPPPYPIFNLEDTILQCQLAVERALTYRMWRTLEIDGDISHKLPVFVVINCPIGLDDPIWPELRARVQSHFANMAFRSNLNFVWSPLNGTPIPDDPAADYRVQATTLFHLPNQRVVPFERIIADETALRSSEESTSESAEGGA